MRENWKKLKNLITYGCEIWTPHKIKIERKVLLNNRKSSTNKFIINTSQLHGQNFFSL